MCDFTLGSTWTVTYDLKWSLWYNNHVSLLNLQCPSSIYWAYQISMCVNVMKSWSQLSMLSLSSLCVFIISSSSGLHIMRRAVKERQRNMSVSIINCLDDIYHVSRGSIKTQNTRVSFHPRTSNMLQMWGEKILISYGCHDPTKVDC